MTKPIDDDPPSLSTALDRISNGDRAAFEDVYQRTSAKLFGVCLRILPVRQEAEEALQEIYLAIWQRAGSFDATRGSPMTWLITLARNRAVDRLRRGKRILVGLDFADDVADDSLSAADALEAGQEEQRLARCMQTLDSRDSKLIRAAFFEGSTYAELATRVTMPLGTVKSRIRRALMQLKACLS